MRISFSNNGWQMDFFQFISFAKEMGANAIEINDTKRLALGESSPLSDYNVKDTARELLHYGLSVSCLDCSIDISKEENFERAKEQIIWLIKTCKIIGCEFIRLYAGEEENKQAVVKVIENVLTVARDYGVILLMETKGVYANSQKLQDLLNSFSDDNFCALWDVHHTHHHGNEKPEVTIKNLGGFVKHVHVKDSSKNGDEIKYCLPGMGEINLKEVYLALRSINFDGYFSLEMQQGWLNDFADPEIVFSQFVSFMNGLCQPPIWENQLYDNKAKTGKFIFEKERLIDLTFPKLLDRVVKEFPDQLAFKYTTLDYTRSYSEFRDDVDTFARALIALGVKKGDKVAVWATNVPEWYISFWATTKIGAILVTVNTAYKIHEAEYLFKQSDTHTLVLIKGWRDCDYAKTINDICPELKDNKKGQPLHAKRLPFLRNVITVGFKQPGCLTFEEALAYSKKVPLKEVIRRANLIEKDDVANMQYTSGTTGFPKGVMLTHYNIVNNGKCIGDRMDLSTADRMMIQVPMFHCFGMVLSMTASMTHGATLCPIPYFSPKPALMCINQERITCFNGVPTMFIALLNHPDFEKTNFSYMRTGIMAGSPCPEPVMKEVLEKMNMTEITIVYGQTEASPGCTMSRAEDSIEVRVSTVGCPLPNIECKIVDPETGVGLGDNQIGEFVARGYNIMKGYYKMPKETAETIDANGWLHTGDLALRRPDGNYKITGRLKDMIIRGGENIYPKEIEDFIYTHDKVHDVQVIGVKDEQYGEEVYACVIVKEDESLTEDELKAWMKDKIAKHKIPRYIEIVESFPQNAAGKVLKYKMREMAEERIKNLKK